MECPNSPLFPPLKLIISNKVSDNGSLVGEAALLPELPEKPQILTSSLEVYIIPTEKRLFIQGFDSNEYLDRPPTLLRGCLLLRVLKPSKIKSISLGFKGQLRTDWPEGIPPKRTTYAEVNDIVAHTWPFYQQTAPTTLSHNGANFFSELPKDRNENGSQPSLIIPDAGTVSNFLTRNLSPASAFRRRTATPSPISSPSLAPKESFSELTSVSTAPDQDANKPGHFPAGDYIYNFEHPIHASVPETTSVAFGEVSYTLEATIARVGTFKPNLTAKIPIEIVRTPSEESMEENEPIVITRDWEDQLRYEIVVAQKSVILDTYLPLAFRFVPLWGKAALHRIRIYVSENIEYYCQNKRVHRTEPIKKYLLLEHKALKGKSLLSRSGGQSLVGVPEEEDEILPKELEFQLYVPKVLNEKYDFELHPDTSFDNIQAHHWIKICLRLSKVDPDNPGKRKHYEVLIDSPIHILSPQAAHGNTILPAYDQHVSPIGADVNPYTPPLSPDVTVVDGSANINNRSQHSNSINQVMDVPRQEFYHINTEHNNDDPIEREPDMHLEANIYKPNNSKSDPKLNSPQALPHPSTFSSPVQRPIHLLRKPSINPPPFKENDSNTDPIVDHGPPPPAYEDLDLLSLSPLRIDDQPRGRFNELDALSQPSMMLNSAQLLLDTPIKELLNQQLKPKRTSSRSTLRDTNSLQSERDSSSMNSRTEDRASNFTGRSSSSRKSSLRKDMGNKPDKMGDLAGDATNKETQQNVLLDSELRVPSVQVQGGEHSDSSASNEYNPSSQNCEKTTRGSSVSSASSVPSPIEQTFPLLAASSASLSTSHNLPNESTTSLNSISQYRRNDSLAVEETKISELFDGIGWNNDLCKINGNLLLLRNPRIKKHYRSNSSKSAEGYNADYFAELNSSNNSTDNETLQNDVSDGAKSHTFSKSPDVIENDHGKVQGLKKDYTIK